MKVVDFYECLKHIKKISYMNRRWGNIALVANCKMHICTSQLLYNLAVQA